MSEELYPMTRALFRQTAAIAAMQGILIARGEHGIEAVQLCESAVEFADALVEAMTVEEA